MSRHPKLGQIARSLAQPWVRGVIRTITRHGVYLRTPYGVQYVHNDDLTTGSRQPRALMQLAPPLTFGKDAR